ncbi:hypothetical protein, partial [Streptomyces sp. NPDC047061]|uniref:hypothetical protein n=1 Tax=Streptomyces sp. NPDC047061 TaxID=3154605 RepID=UPI0033EA373F
PPPAHPAQLMLRQTRRSPATKILEDPLALQTLEVSTIKVEGPMSQQLSMGAQLIRGEGV